MKKILFPILSALCLCSCTKTESINENINNSTNIVDTTIPINEEKHTSIKTESNSSELYNEDETILQLYHDFAENGYLYDFDLDGIPELFQLNYAVLGEICIYKIIDENVSKWGTIKYNSIHPEWFTVDKLTLYYDKTNEEYFYVCEFDIWEKYFNYADLNKYTIKYDCLVESNIAHCEFDYTEVENAINFQSNILLGENTEPIGLVDWNSITSYFEGADDYLSSFDKIKVISLDELTANKLNNDSYN